MTILENSVFEKNISHLCSFKLGSSIYAIPALRVREIVRPSVVTPIPRSSGHIGGLINFRGKIVAAIKMRKLLGVERKMSDKAMNVIVQAKNSLFCLEVDEVMDVVDVSGKVLNETPGNIDKNIKYFTKGIYRLNDGLAILLDLDKVLNTGKKEGS